VVAALPPMIVFGFLQKYFIKGLTSGSVKEWGIHRFRRENERIMFWIKL
jgi:hypothetical protein